MDDQLCSQASVDFVVLPLRIMDCYIPGGKLVWLMNFASIQRMRGIGILRGIEEGDNSVCCP